MPAALPESDTLKAARLARGRFSMNRPSAVAQYVRQQPTERQRLFLECNQREVFYGGAAGGGKSSALLMDALRYVEHKGYSALLLRRTYQDLAKPGALMDRAQEWLSGTSARWNEQKKQWRFPSGAVITFGYLENDNDIYQYQGGEYQFVGFDELTQFTERQYTYLFSRLRRLRGADVPLKMRSASNPGGIGADWVQARFIPDEWTPADALQARVFLKDGRAFVPARAGDNPHLDQAEYTQSLANLDDVLRAQLEEGDWLAREKGNIFPMWEDGPNSRHVITWSEFASVYGRRYIPDHWKRAVGHDWGSTEGHPAVVTACATSAENSAFPGLYFVYYGQHWIDALEGDIADTLDVVIPARLRATVERWQMSHEAKSERKTYRDKHGIPFVAMDSGKWAGVSQMRHLLTVKGNNAPFPFRPVSRMGQGLYGCPRLLFVVDDGEFTNPRTDRGLVRHRGEMAAYKVAEKAVTLASGQPAAVPYKFYDDAIDSMRGIFARWGPAITGLTDLEQQEMALNPAYRMAEATPEQLANDGWHMAREWRLGRVKEADKLKNASVFDPFSGWTPGSGDRHDDDPFGGE
jgi:hypothetical protein